MRCRFLFLVCCFLLGAFLPAVSQQNQYQGSLELLLQNSITVRLDDGRLIDALRPASGVATKPALPDLPGSFEIGDRVEIDVVPLSPTTFDPERKLFFYRGLHTLKLLGKPTPKQMAAVLASRDWRVSKNLLHLPNGIQIPTKPAFVPSDDVELEEARTAVLQYVAALTNFVADEKVSRQTKGRYLGNAQANDTIVSELSVVAREESRTKILLDGKPWSKDFAELPGEHWGASYSDHLQNIFGTDCGTRFSPEARTTENGRPALMYRYNTPSEGCYGSISDREQRVYPGAQGRIVIDAATHLPLRLEDSMTELPAAFPLSSVESIAYWQFQEIAGVPRLVLVSAELTASNSSGSSIIQCTYSNYRHFETTHRFTMSGH